MRRISKTIIILTLTLGCSLGVTANATDAVGQLFSLLNKGGCESSSLTGNTWTITTGPVNTHGELVLGDMLDFELIGIATGITRKGAVQVMRNGVIWLSASGWSGQCTTDGTISQYVISGDIDIGGCLHELAIGRLDHDNNLSNKIEVVFQDSGAAAAGGCEESNYLHPGHAHGTEGPN